MNKRRRRIGRARRAKARLLHEIRNWTKTNYTKLPVRGRLVLPVLRLATGFETALERMHTHALAVLSPVLAFARSGPEKGEE